MTSLVMRPPRLLKKARVTYGPGSTTPACDCAEGGEIKTAVNVSN